ncbi:MAG TPA: FtsX-like permease family protein [Oscillospiraceae bacterium]|nr:FtsX-like permease family protein [Oscillospiraceae bacterium]
MVMAKQSFYKELVRSIWQSRGRFFSVMAIIFLGVSFFAGINATEPDMVLSADKYFKEQHLSDLRIFSPLGFAQQDLTALEQLSKVATVQKGYSKDLFFTTAAGTTSVVKLMSYEPSNFTEQNGVNIPYLVAGRFPEKSGEILLVTGIGVPPELELDSTITVTVSDENGPLEYLTTAQFTVVGSIISPLYVTYERGQTNIGDGSVAYAAYALEKDFKLAAYNEAYLLVQDTDKEQAYSTAYEHLIAPPQAAVEALGRQAVLRDTKELREKLEEGKQTFLAEKQLAEEKLAAGQKKLDEAEEELINGEALLKEQEERYTKEIAAAKVELTVGKEALEQGKLKYFDGYTAWLEGYNQYQDGKAALLEAKAELDDAKVRLEAGERELAAARSELEDARQQLVYLQDTLVVLREIEASLPDSDSELTEEEYRDLITRLEQVSPELARLIESSFDYNDPNLINSLRSALQTAITELENQYETGQKQLLEGEQQLAAAEKTLQDNKKLYDEAWQAYQPGVRELEASKVEIDQAKAKLERARQEIERNSAKLWQGERELLAAEAELQTSLATGIQELEAGKIELAAGRETFAREKEEALLKIAEAEAEIKEAERQLLELPKEWFVYTRDGNPGYAGYGDDAARVGAVAKIFPLFFFLVAALVCLTTMTRMIEEERMQIGTLKALGYGTWLISSKYLVYAFLASLVGSVLGFTIGFQLFPRVIMTIYGAMYDIPYLLSPFHLNYALISLAIAISTTVVAALAASLATLQSTPAQLMQPKAPKPGKRIFLERLPFFWERLNFIQKVTVRNIFRYKKRFFMTVLGIAGCTALLLTGYGIRDSVNVITEKQFDQIFLYDGMVIIDVEADAEAELAQILGTKREVDTYTDALMEVVTVSQEQGTHNYEANLMIPADERRLTDYFDLHERQTAAPLPLTKEGAVVTEKLAQLLDVAVGDVLVYQDTDNRTYQITIAGIAENYLAHHIFMSREYFETVTLREPHYNAGIFTLHAADNFNDQQFRESLLNDDAVVGITLASIFQTNFRDTLASLDYVVLILILAAGALAFVVLYNLTNINITERLREIATIKVLGFRDREVSSYVYRENMILSFFGTLLGLVLGCILHKFVMETMEVDNIMFGKSIMPFSFLYAVLLTMFFSILVNFIMYFRLKQVDMVESLKSVE